METVLHALKAMGKANSVELAARLDISREEVLNELWELKKAGFVDKSVYTWRVAGEGESGVFDPPHLERVGDNAWMGKKYGRLNKDTWRDDLRQGFKEAFRVLRPYGVLIFKWNEAQISVRQILALTDVKPIISQRTGKNDKTHWIIFMKEATSG